MLRGRYARICWLRLSLTGNVAQSHYKSLISCLSFSDIIEINVKLFEMNSFKFTVLCTIYRENEM